MRDYMGMVPPDFRPDGRRYKEQLEFDATWSKLYEEYRPEAKKLTEERDWEGYDACVERYREKLLEGEDEWINPPLNSTLLAKVGLRVRVRDRFRVRVRVSPSPSPNLSLTPRRPPSTAWFTSTRTSGATKNTLSRGAWRATTSAT